MAILSMESTLKRSEGERMEKLWLGRAEFAAPKVQGRNGSHDTSLVVLEDEKVRRDKAYIPERKGTKWVS